MVPFLLHLCMPTGFECLHFLLGLHLPKHLRILDGDEQPSRFKESCQFTNVDIAMFGVLAILEFDTPGGNSLTTKSQLPVSLHDPATASTVKNSLPLSDLWKSLAY